MIIFSQENDLGIQEMCFRFTDDEWKMILQGKTIMRVTGYNKGYYRFEVKAIKIKDPYQ